jgi:glycosyltransferase involved in cell wall biosynthesis
MRTACVIPALNERDSISDVVSGCRRWGLDVYVVDDGSTDGTGDRARSAGALVLRHEAPLGKGRSLADGAARAASDSFEAVVFLDADGQHDPAELPAFLDAGRAGADIVLGCRSFDEKMPFVRRVTNRFQGWLLSAIARRPLGDTQSGYRLVRLSAWPRIMPAAGGFAAESEMLVNAARLGLRISFVPIKTIYHGTERSHIRPVRDALRFFSMIARLGWASGLDRIKEARALLGKGRVDEHA